MTQYNKKIFINTTAAAFLLLPSVVFTICSKSCCYLFQIWTFFSTIAILSMLYLLAFLLGYFSLSLFKNCFFNRVCGLQKGLRGIYLSAIRRPKQLKLTLYNQEIYRGMCCVYNKNDTTHSSHCIVLSIGVTLLKQALIWVMVFKVLTVNKSFYQRCLDKNRAGLCLPWLWVMRSR